MQIIIESIGRRIVLRQTGNSHDRVERRPQILVHHGQEVLPLGNLSLRVCQRTPERFHILIDAMESIRDVLDDQHKTLIVIRKEDSLLIAESPFHVMNRVINNMPVIFLYIPLYVFERKIFDNLPRIGIDRIIQDILPDGILPGEFNSFCTGPVFVGSVESRSKPARCINPDQDFILSL